MKHPYQAFLFLCVMFLASCAQLGVQPQSFNANALAVQLTITEVRATSGVLLDAKLISSDDHSNVTKAADVAREGLEVAKKLAKVDVKTAEGKLSAVKVGLDAVRTYLLTFKK